MAHIQKIRYTHDAMIDLIITQPWLRQFEVAQHFGMSQAWISQVFCSDAFKMRLAERRAELVDPTIIMSLEEEFESVARLSMSIVKEQLEIKRNPEHAIAAMSVAAKALGFGARNVSQQNIQQNNVVVMVPAKAADSASWAANCIPIPTALKAAS